MNLIEKAKNILEKDVCDHCLGRQYAQLLHGYSNDQRGRIVRTMAAMSSDEEGKKEVVKGVSSFSFNRADIKSQKPKAKCGLCNDFFTDIDKWTKKIEKALDRIEFSTFAVGSRLPFSLLRKEEELWEKIGIDDCEPLKAEINREVGKRLEKQLRKKADLKSPDINILLDLSRKKIEIKRNPLFIYGEYNKLRRGIPQTKWPSRKYKTSVEEIIAKPFMSATQGSRHKLHGAGREDIDALCLGWRPFVLEILEPKVRNVKINKLAKKIAKSVKVRKLHFSSIQEVRRIKTSRASKTYRMLVKCSSLKKSELKKLSSIRGEIKQQTPERVMHRRSDRKRKRKVFKIGTKYVNRKKFILTVTTEAGLYVKELVTGDNGRTKPSISEILGKKCVCGKLSVIKIEKK